MDNLPTLGIGAWLFVSTYLLVARYWLAARGAQKQYFKGLLSGGKWLRILSPFLNFFATQYSGTTLPLQGLLIESVLVDSQFTLHDSCSCGLSNLCSEASCFSKRKNYLTPADFIDDRYSRKLLSLVISIIMIVVLCNFTLAQLMAMGRAAQAFSVGRRYRILIRRRTISPYYGYICTLGGIRAIAWTDALQALSYFSFAFLLLMVDRFGPLENATRILMERDSILSTLTTRPDADACIMA